MSTLFVILCFRVTTIHLNINQASVETEARGVPPNKSPCIMMFADDIVFMGKSWEEMETKLKSWRVMLERGGMKARRSKT